MSSRETKNISLTAEQSRYIDQHVESGHYQSASEVVRDALRLMQERESIKSSALADVRRKILKGLVQASQGKLRDGEEYFRALIERIDAKGG